MLVEGLLLHRRGADGVARTIRICHIFEDRPALGVIDIFDPNAEPEAVPRVPLEEELVSGECTEIAEDPYASLRDPKYDDQRHEKAEKFRDRRKRRDRNYSLIKRLVEDPRIFFRKTRGPMIAKRANRIETTKRHIYTLIRHYFQRGMMPNALLPAYDNCGGKGEIRGPNNHFLPKRLMNLTEPFIGKGGVRLVATGLYALFVRYLKRLFDKKKFTLEETLQVLWRMSLAVARS